MLVSGELDVTVAFVSTQLDWRDEHDVVIQPDPTNGLRKVSLIRLSKLATLDKSLVLGRLGTVDATTLELVNQSLRNIFLL